MAVDWPTIAVMVAIGGLLWRQIAAVDQRFEARFETLTGRVGDLDRRLARLEGWIEGERAGAVRAAPVETATGAAP